MSLISAIRRYGGAAVSFIRPIIYLWPWVLGLGLFAAVVDSPQGVVLAERYREAPSLHIVIVLSVSWLTVGMACLLALLVSAVRTPIQSDDNPDRRVGARARVLAGGVWIVAVASGYGAFFARATHRDDAWLTVATLALAGAAGIIWMTWSICDESSAASRVLAGVRRHHLVVALLVLFLSIAPLAAGALIAMSTPGRLADAGPLLVAMIGIASLSTLFGVIIVAIPVYLRLPWIGLVYVAGMMAWASLQPLPIDGDNPLLRSSVEDASERQRNDPACKPSPTSLDSALKEHTKGPGYQSSLPLDRSIYLVSAEGGGIRAAYWTALNLARLDIATQGRFGEEVAALSGVSGGSLGIGTWLAARDRTDLTPRARLDLITSFLSSDFLSPLVGGFLFLDVPRLLLGPAWPSARRDHVFEKALADRWAEIGRTDFFARPLFLGCMRGFTAVPAVYYNATDSETGAYVPLTSSPVPTEGLMVQYPESELQNLRASSIGTASVAQMIHISARFPYLSPEAKVGVDAVRIASAIDRDQSSDAAQKTAPARNATDEFWTRQWILVDGGYFDNTGLTPTRKALSLINQSRGWERMPAMGEEPRYTRTLVKVIHISNDPGWPCLKLSGDWRGRLSSRAQRFVDLTKGTTIHCEGDVSALERSLVESVLLPFLVPIQTLLNVRPEQSKGALRDLREAISREAYSPEKHRWTELQEISLATAFDDAFGTGPTIRPRPDLSMPSQENVKKVDTQMADADIEIQRLVRDRRASEASARTYLEQLREWQDVVRYEARSAECHKELEAVGPPLGWTLSKSNEALMQCLAVRQAIGNGWHLAPPRWPTDWPLSYPGVFAPSSIRNAASPGATQPPRK